MKTLLIAVVLTLVAVLLVVAGIVSIAINSSKQANQRDEPYRQRRRNRNHGQDPATCLELHPLEDFTMRSLEGAWVLREKLEFPDGMQHHTTVPNRDQTAVCLRSEIDNITDTEASLHTSFFLNHRLNKKFDGFIKVMESGHWDLHMLSKDHDGMVVDAEKDRYFVFIECVTPTASGGEAEQVSVPGSVFVFTRGTLHDTEMDRIRLNVETLLRHNDELFLDFGVYCY